MPRRAAANWAAMCYHGRSKEIDACSHERIRERIRAMKDVLPTIEDWRERGERIAIATVVKTLGSAPRGVGAKMVVSAGGAMAGSVSGGCIEGAVFDACQEAIKSGKARLLHFGVADDDAWDVGLACGGVIDVFVEPLDW
jgi:xanthine/CO dehydrogenase XdhC/CoxF family maturation factor